MKSFVLVLGLLAQFIVAAPSSSIRAGDWTYKHAYDYAISRGGIDDPTAGLISQHVISTATVEWDDIYNGDISHDGGILVVRDTPHGRSSDRIHGYEPLAPTPINPSVVNTTLPYSPETDGNNPTIRSTASSSATISSFVIGYPWVSNCNDSVYFEWKEPINQCSCYTYISGGKAIRMYSARAKVLNNTGWKGWQSSSTCAGGPEYSAYNVGTYCFFTVDGRGFMGTQIC